MESENIEQIGDVLSCATHYYHTTDFLHSLCTITSITFLFAQRMQKFIYCSMLSLSLHESKSNSILKFQHNLVVYYILYCWSMYPILAHVTNINNMHTSQHACIMSTVFSISAVKDWHILINTQPASMCIFHWYLSQLFSTSLVCTIQE